MTALRVLGTRGDDRLCTHRRAAATGVRLEREFAANAEAASEARAFANRRPTADPGVAWLFFGFIRDRSKSGCDRVANCVLT